MAHDYIQDEVRTNRHTKRLGYTPLQGHPHPTCKAIEESLSQLANWAGSPDTLKFEWSRNQGEKYEYQLDVTLNELDKNCVGDFAAAMQRGWMKQIAEGGLAGHVSPLHTVANKSHITLRHKDLNAMKALVDTIMKTDGLEPIEAKSRTRY